MRQTRRWVVLIFFCVLLLPVVGSSAADQDELDGVTDQLEAIRQRIELHEDQAGSLKEKVETVSEDITDLEVAVNALSEEIDTVRSQAIGVQARIGDTEESVAKVEELALDQAVALYKGGTTGALDALLSSKSLGDLNDRTQMLEISGENNTDALIKYGRLKSSLDVQYDELVALQENLDARLAEREEYQAELEGRKEAMVADIAELNSQLEEDKNDEAHKEEQYDDIKAQILAAQEEAASETSPPASSPSSPPTETAPSNTGPPPSTGSTSASGFVWPINGAVTSPFGYRWGRMHEGIDIDGYTGQPIVATKPGQVISAGDSGDGYGTKVVIDHGGGFTSLYAHMSRIAVSGGSVAQGQVIGYVGCTGSCTGDHLHFEIRANGTPQNPLSYLP